MKSKDETERDSVQVLSAYKYQLRPFILPSGKDIWKKTVTGMPQDMWIILSVLFFLHLLILKKRDQLLSYYIRDNQIVFLDFSHCKKCLINIRYHILMFSKHKRMCPFSPWNHPAIGFYSWHNLFTLSQKTNQINHEQKSLYFGNVWLRSVEVTDNSKCWIYCIALQPWMLDSQHFLKIRYVEIVIN